MRFLDFKVSGGKKPGLYSLELRKRTHSETRMSNVVYIPKIVTEEGAEIQMQARY